jgi:putative membrane protein insertion efficiency factor
VETFGPYIRRALDLVMKTVSIVLVAALWSYRTAVSPLLGPCCRFAPSCSVYASQAINRHGAARGTWMALKRVLRCHPFHPGGWDPVG